MTGIKETLGPLPYDGEPPAQKHSRTSRDAATSIKHHVGPMHRRILDWLDLYPAGGSDERIARELDMGQNTFRPRRRELQLMEYIENSGKTELTRARREAVIWVRARGE
jgi:hypothetical protein